MLESANRVDKAAESFSRSASGINGGIWDAVAKLQSQTEKMDAARESSERTSARALQATIDNFHSEQRAWVGIDESGAIDWRKCDTTNPTATCTLTLLIRNTGRTPALAVKRAIGFELSTTLDKQPRLDSLRLIEDKLRNSDNGRSLAPQGTLNLEITDGDAYVSSHWPKVVSRVDYLYLFGRIDYSDIFGGSHSSVFCLYVKEPATKQVASCDAYNEMK